MKIYTFYFGENHCIPNNQRYPVILYKNTGGLTEHKKPEDIIRLNGWKGIWENGIYDYHHYHSNAHEVLWVKSGSANIILGGPEGKEFYVETDDVLLLSAGTGHCRIKASADFKVVGAYPAGQEDYEINTAEDNLKEKKKIIASVPLPEKDPVIGDAQDGIRSLWCKKD